MEKPEVIGNKSWEQFCSHCEHCKEEGCLLQGASIEILKKECSEFISEHPELSRPEGFKDYHVLVDMDGAFWLAEIEDGLITRGTLIGSLGDPTDELMEIVAMTIREWED